MVICNQSRSARCADRTSERAAGNALFRLTKALDLADKNVQIAFSGLWDNGESMSGDRRHDTPDEVEGTIVSKSRRALFFGIDVHGHHFTVLCFEHERLVAPAEGDSVYASQILQRHRKHDYLQVFPTSVTRGMVSWPAGVVFCYDRALFLFIQEYWATKHLIVVPPENNVKGE